jgi:hypothetical protein
MRFSQPQQQMLRESAISLEEKYPGIRVHFAQTHESDAVSTISYPEEPEVGSHLGEHPTVEPSSEHSMCLRAVEVTVDKWKMLGVAQPMTNQGYRERGGRSEHFWTVTGQTAG